MAWAWAGFFANYIIIDYMYRYMVETWVFKKKNYRILIYVSALLIALFIIRLRYQLVLV